MQIRDFIYLDIDRLRSIVAQKEKGIIETFNESESNTKEISGNIQGGLSSVLKLAGGLKYLFQKQETQTKTFHDYIYNKVEDELIKSEILIHIPEQITVEDISNSQYLDMLSDSSFILVDGKIIINDFSQMRIIIENINKIGEFIAQCNILSESTGTKQSVKDQKLRELKQQLTFDKKMIEGFKLFFDVFYKDRIIIKVIPFDDYPDFRLVGNLNGEYLRDDISSITYKYGTAPASKWVVFAQIASIPTKDRINLIQEYSGSQIEVALQRVFDSFRDIELLAQSVNYPEIAITPIAIYRE
jgi:hypothetical protein